jgi:hypothetical protein
MSPEPAPVPFRQILGELVALCSARQTGTLFIATASNESARIGLKQGEIVSLVFRNQRGLEALDHLRKIAAGRFNFTNTVLDRGERGDLPLTPDLLAMLGAEEPLTVAPRPRGTGGTPPTAGKTPPGPHENPQLASAQEAIESELTEYLGPMAVIVCREHVARTVAAGAPYDIGLLVDAVALEIGDRAKEARFRQQVLARLAGG